MITALTVSREKVARSWEGVQHRCLFGREFKRASEVQAAWFDAVALVDTPYFFFIDDDDDLPSGHLDVLQRCLDAQCGVAYTDEDVNGERRCRREYSQAAHLADPTLAHHLVLCDTDVARDVIQDLPRGEYWPEMMLYWEMAKRAGAKHIPGVGYVWNKKASGLHKDWFTVRGMSNSRSWCAANR